MTKQIRRTWPALVAAAALSGARAQAGVLFYEGFQYSSHAVPGTAVEESDRRDAALAFGHYWILNGSLRYKKVSPLMTSGNMAGIPSGGLLALSFTNEFDKGGVARVLWLSFLIRAGAQDNDTERSNYLHLMDSRMKALDVNVYTDEDAWRPREYLEGFFTAGGLAVGLKTDTTHLMLFRLEFGLKTNMVTAWLDPRVADGDPPGGVRHPLEISHLAEFELTLFSKPCWLDEVRVGDTAVDVMPRATGALVNEGAAGDTVPRIPQQVARPRATALPGESGLELADALLDAVVTIKGGEGSGTGFIAAMDGTNYIFSNIHVLMGNRGMKIADRRGRTHRPLMIEAAGDRDLVRMALPAGEPAALTISEPRGINTPVAVCGNAEGEDVIRPVMGKLVGIGGQKIETDAPFVEGHSGSPILGEKGSVFGVATYVTVANPNWVNTNTPFTEVRRFGYRIDTVRDWVPVSSSWFVKESQLIAGREKRLRAVFGVITQWSRNPFWNDLPESEGLPQGMRSWVVAHNEIARRNRQRAPGDSVTFQTARDMGSALKAESVRLVEELQRDLRTPSQKFHLKFFDDCWKDIEESEKMLIKVIPRIEAAYTSALPGS